MIIWEINMKAFVFNNFNYKYLLGLFTWMHLVSECQITASKWDISLCNSRLSLLSFCSAKASYVGLQTAYLQRATLSLLFFQRVRVPLDPILRNVYSTTIWKFGLTNAPILTKLFYGNSILFAGLYMERYPENILDNFLSLRKRQIMF